MKNSLRLGALISCFALLSGFSVRAYAQPYWISESPTPAPNEGYGSAMAYDAAHGQVVLFGGSGLLTDTWVWNGTTWTQTNPAHHPAGRYAHAMAYDAAHGQVVLFGGFDSPANTNTLSDTWVWNGTDWTNAFTASKPHYRQQPARACRLRHDLRCGVRSGGLVRRTGNLGRSRRHVGVERVRLGAEEPSPLPARTQPSRHGLRCGARPDCFFRWSRLQQRDVLRHVGVERDRLDQCHPCASCSQPWRAFHPHHGL